MHSNGLKKLREEKGFTQTKLAKIIGVDPSTYCNYERGVRTPRDLNVIVKLSNALDISVAQSLGVFLSGHYKQKE